MIRVFLRLLVLVLAAGGRAVAQPLPDRVPLLGTAVDSAEKPLEGVVITIRRQESQGPYAFWGAALASDASGAWRFGQAEVGRYYLSAESPGFAPITNLSVDWKPGSPPLRLRFERLVNLQVKVLTATGAPLTNAPLWFRLRGDAEAGQVTRRALSDAVGQATIGELLPSTYALWVASPGGYAIQNGLVLRENKEINLALQRGGALSVAVSQNGENGRKLGGATLSVTPENIAQATRALGSSADLNENVALLAASGDPLSILSRDSDGQIEIGNLPPGRYLLRLRLPGYVSPEPRIIDIEAGQTTDLNFHLTPSVPAQAALTLDLRVKDEKGIQKSAPAGEWSLRVLPIDQNGALRSETPEEGAFSPGGNAPRRARTDASGRLTLFPLPVGRYRVFVAPRVSPPVDGEPEAASLDVDVPASGATASLVVLGTP